MNKYGEKAILKLIEHYGVTAQLYVAIEELSELIKELCKLRRNKYVEAHMIDEVTDVTIIIEQINFIFGNPIELLNREDCVEPKDVLSEESLAVYKKDEYVIFCINLMSKLMVEVSSFVNILDNKAIKCSELSSDVFDLNKLQDVNIAVNIMKQRLCISDEVISERKHFKYERALKNI